MGLGPLEHLVPRTQITIGTFSLILISSLNASVSLFLPTAVLIFPPLSPFINAF